MRWGDAWAALLLVQALTLSACTKAPSHAAPELGPAEAHGRAVFKASCARCHAASGDGVVVGPSLAGIATRGGTRIEGMDAEAYIRDSILDPGNYTVEGFPKGLMPPEGFADLDDAELDDLVAYLMTLR